MNTITKTEWNMMHSDYKKVEHGKNFVTGFDINTRESYWVEVKIKGVKVGTVYS